MMHATIFLVMLGNSKMTHWDKSAASSYNLFLSYDFMVLLYKYITPIPALSPPSPPPSSPPPHPLLPIQRKSWSWLTSLLHSRSNINP